MAQHTFLQAPELAFAVPFNNMSFERWDGALPDQWARSDVSPTGTVTKYNPGFDMTRALQISDTGVIGSGSTNGIIQTIVRPPYIPNGQLIRAGYAEISALTGYGAAKAVWAIGQTGGPAIIGSLYLNNSASWTDYMWDNASNPISTAYPDIWVKLWVLSYNSAANPAAVFDSLFMEYGRTIAERYWTFTYLPEASGTRIAPFTFGQADRTARGKRRTYDPSGGAVKWRVTFPFQNVPDSFVEGLLEFWRRNKGLADSPGVPLILHHNVQDPAATHTAGRDWLRRPPYIVCDIVEDEFPFQPAGSFLGRKLFNGTLTFEEI